MSRGIEMMLANALKAFGVNPQQIVNTFQQLLEFTKSIDARLKRLEDQQERILNLLEGRRIEHERRNDEGNPDHRSAA